MTYDEILSLGWKDTHPKSKNEKGVKTFVFEAPGYDYHIMSVCFGMEEDDGIYDQIVINCVPENTLFNEWENSETNFYGDVKKKEELDLVMQLVGVTKYRENNL